MTPFAANSASPGPCASEGRGVRIRLVTDRGRWQECLDRLAPPTFLQSWEWGEFNRRQGNRVFRLGLTAGDEGRQLDGLALLVSIAARRARFLFCPHGPVLPANRAAEWLPPIVGFLKELARQEQAHFIRVSSQLPDTGESWRLFRRLGFRPAPIHMHPELAWMLDVTPDVARLMSGMRKTMRQGIRKAMRLGVTVTAGRTAADLSAFLDLYRVTAQRQHFVAFPGQYLADELAAFGAAAQIFLARFHGEVLSGAFIVFSGRSGFYHHGCSRPTREPIPAAYLLQWEVIQAVKRRGCAWYNFWGIAPPHRPRHPWAGLTAFKQGFGGLARAYLPAQDLRLTSRYWLNYWVEKMRKVRRGL